jgi:hypothetical protein
MKSHKAVVLISMALAVVLLFNLWCAEATAETILWSGPDTPAHLALSKRYLFWSDDSETPVKRMPICGGEAISIATKMGVPANLTIKGQNIYWIDVRSGRSPTNNCFKGSGMPATGILNKSPLDGTSKTELARDDLCRGGADDIVVDETHVYWVSSRTTPDEWYINKVPVAGGDSTTLVTVTHGDVDGIREMAGDATHIYFTEGSAIKKIPKSGGQIEIVADGEFYRGLALHNGEIFFSGYFDYYTYSLKKVSVLGGSVTTLATVTRDPFEPKNYVWAMAADNENLYWVDKKSVNAVPVNGGSITTLASILNEPIDIVVNGGQVIWTESTGPGHGETGTVKSVSTSGGAVITLVQGGDAPRKLALSNSDIYWTEGGVIGLIEGFGRIAKIPIGGGNATTVIFGVMGDSPPIASDDRYLYIGDKWALKKVSIDGSITEKMYGANFDIEDLATDGTNVYWIMHPFGTVFKMPVSGGQAILLSSQPSGYPGPIRVHNEYVYWITSYDTISKVGVGGGGFVTLATDLPFIDDFVVDDTHVFFSEHDTGRIRRMSINGGPISTIGNVSLPPFHLAVDEHSLYWISSREIGAMLKDGGSPTIIDQQVLSDIYGNGSIAVDPTGVYWTETNISAIMKHELGECYKSTANPGVFFLLLGE